MARVTEFWLGSSYYPEQWPENRWANDFAMMADLGFNVARMGEFAWSEFEPQPGQFNFGWMDRAIDLAAKRGIKTILCTPTAACPPWLRQRHPDVLGANEKGLFDFGARKGYCTNSENLRSACEKVVDAMAEHYAKHPHVLAWQLDNEPGYPFQCFDKANCLPAFHRWLRERYKTLDALNAAWFTAFWSHRYTAWDQIEFPLNRGDGAWNPGERLDYRRFFSDSYLGYLDRQVRPLRKHIGDETVVFTNWPNTFWSIDVFQTAKKLLTATAWDNYQRPAGLFDWREPLGAGLHHDLCRIAGPEKRWFVAEQASQAPTHADSAGVFLQTVQDFAHGASGCIFFEWRPPLGGAEQGYVSVLNLDGTLGPAEAHHRRLGKLLSELGPELADAVTDADIALLYSYDNQWEQGFWSGPDGYDAEAERWYKGLKHLHRNIDVVPATADWSRYRVVAAPGFRIVSDDEAKRLIDYVKNGGVLVLNSQAATRQVNNQYRELVSPGLFAEVAGIRITASASKDAMAGNLITGRADQAVIGYSVKFGEGESTKSFAVATAMDGIDLLGAEPLATFTGGRMEGRPAITIHAHGKGHVIFVGADSRDADFYDAIASMLATRFAIPPLMDVPPGIEIVSRRSPTTNTEYLFLMNWSTQAKRIALPKPCKDRITNRQLKDSVELASLDAMILT